MGAVSLGPLVMATDRLAAILGIGAFLLAASLLSDRKDARFGPWAAIAVPLGVVAARLGHVLEHAGTFAQEPLRAFAFWQGGFSFLWAIPPVLLFTLYRLREVRALIWATAPVAFGMLAWAGAFQLAALASGDPRPLPSITLQQVQGDPIDLADTDGRPRVLNLWATWCPPCRREMPLLAEVSRATPGVDFLFVNQGEGSARIVEYLSREGLELTHVVLDSTSEITRYFGVRGIPVTLFFGADGRMRHLHVGEVSREALAEYLRSIRGAS
ncbi:TlpA family protein disulfide reductase [Roseomonas sp. KE2513]|uniref:TlpA disulfide reductase family protein n=1 Tax=Roseomonas sp. KE2513 TaxID=2479202 RepID=UPI0018DFB948|nr:TlpA disulfide reductase family protein [Roseomonas sp. KE2513]MBI0537007.1 TlpA family protein disulfide reductase [Roseomonas sp. KE2513]